MFDNAGRYLPATPSWGGAARLQIRVISALVRREMRAHFGELRLGYLWAVIEPALHLLVYILLFEVIFKRQNPLGGSLALFMFTGMIPYFLFYKLATYLAGAIDENRSLLNLPPIKPFDMIVSRAILESTTYLFVGFILLTCLYISGTTEAVPYHPIQLAAALTATVGLGVGIGMINAIIRVFIRNWTAIFSLLISPLFLLSGIWFLPTEIPSPFRDYLLYNPLMHYIMWARSGFYRDYDPGYLDIGYAICWSVSAMVLGLALMRVAHRKLLEPV